MLKKTHAAAAKIFLHSPGAHFSNFVSLNEREERERERQERERERERLKREKNKERAEHR